MWASAFVSSSFRSACGIKCELLFSVLIDLSSILNFHQEIQRVYSFLIGRSAPVKAMMLKIPLDEDNADTIRKITSCHEGLNTGGRMCLILGIANNRINDDLITTWLR